MKRRELLKYTGMIMGCAVTGSTITAILQACQAESAIDWRPLALSDKQAATLSALVDRILPQTETPGAKELQVDQFIDRMLKEVFPNDIQDAFAKSLDEFDQECKEKHGKSFTACKNDQKDDLIRDYEQKSGAMPGSIWGFAIAETSNFPFYRLAKELTLLGYFSSEEIGRNILNYDPVPGDYVPCLPVSEVGNVWTE